MLCSVSFVCFCALRIHRRRRRGSLYSVLLLFSKWRLFVRKGLAVLGAHNVRIKLSLISIKSMWHKGIECIRSAAMCAFITPAQRDNYRAHLAYTANTSPLTAITQVIHFANLNIICMLLSSPAPGNQCELCTANATFSPFRFLHFVVKLRCMAFGFCIQEQIVNERLNVNGALHDGRWTGSEMKI